MAEIGIASFMDTVARDKLLQANTPKTSRRVSIRLGKRGRPTKRKWTTLDDRMKEDMVTAREIEEMMEEEQEGNEDNLESDLDELEEEAGVVGSEELRSFDVILQETVSS